MEEVEETEELVAPVRPVFENIDPATATESEQTAYRFICKLVEDMELADVTIAMHPGNNDDMVITVDGEAAGVLIGHHGDTLDALQYLANLAANRKEEGEKREYARITVDVESYRAKREDALRILARKKAHQVLKYKKSIMLEPMNPYERRIIHSAISKMEGVRSESKGEGRDRRVVIYSTAPDAQTENTYGERRGRGGNRNGRRPGGSRNGGYRGERRIENGGRNSGYRGSRSGAPRGSRPSSVPERSYAPRDAESAAPVAPKRTERVDDFADFSFGKIEL